MALTLIFNWLKKNAALLLLHLVCGIIVVQNFPLNSWLIGWDAVNPEFNYQINLEHAVLAGWQPHYGTGALTGHAFAATLPNIIFSFFLDVFLPQSTVRLVLTHLTWYVGGLGMFFLTKYLFEQIQYVRKSSWISSWSALTASLFYLLNFGTTQIFYVPLEAFTFHFAFLPWAFLLLYDFLCKPNKKTVFFLFIGNFLLSGQAFVPSVFVGYILSIVVFCSGYLLLHLRTTTLSKLFLAFTIIVVANSYWLLPFLYYTTTHTDIYLNSYTNKLTTLEFVAKSQKYGDVHNVLFLKSFFLESKLFNEDVFAPWIAHWNGLYTQVTGLILFTLSIIGVLISFLKRNYRQVLLPFVLAGLFFFMTLGTQIPILSLVTKVAQQLSPQYEQAFRIAFTKVGIGVGFWYSLGLSTAVFFFIHVTFLLQKRITFFLPASVACLILLYATPHFYGHMFYHRLITKLPPDYLRIIDYFNAQPERERIAELPIDCSEGWYSYEWKYTGSGFYWYALAQPVMSRSFDVWSTYNEHYYFSMRQALQTRDISKVKDVLRQYDIKWIIFDENSIHCTNKKVYEDQANFIDLFKADPNFTVEYTSQEGNIKPIYIFSFTDVELSNFQTSFVPQSPIDGSDFTISDESVTFQPSSDKLNNRNSELLLPSAFDTKSHIPAQLQSVLKNNEIEIQLTLYPLNLHLLNQPASENLSIIPLLTIPKEASNASWYVNQHEIQTGQVLLSTLENNTFEVITDKGDLLGEWTSSQSTAFQDVIKKSDLISYQNEKELQISFNSQNIFNTYQQTLFSPPRSCTGVPNPNSKYQLKTDTEKRITEIMLIDQNSEQCIEAIIEKRLMPDGGLMSISLINTIGLPPKIVLIDDQSRILYATILKNGKNTLVIPPPARDSRFISIVIQNKAYSANFSSNKISGFDLRAIPLRQLEKIKYVPSQPAQLHDEFNINDSISFYTNFTHTFTKNTLITLSSSFDKGWVALVKNSNQQSWQILPHEEVNGWKNGWNIEPGTYQVIIMYWPQLLSLIGYLITILVTFILVFFYLNYYFLKYKLVISDTKHKRISLKIKKMFKK